LRLYAPVFIGRERPLQLPFDTLPTPEANIADAMDDQRFLKIRGVRDLQARERKSYHVGKYGMTTGLTFGIVGEIEAILREPCAGAGEVISWALLIVSASRKTYPGQPFSAHGDSGSGIFDLSGNLVGVLDAGQESHEVRRCGKAYTEEEPKLPPIGTPVTAAPTDFTGFDESYGLSRQETEKPAVDVTFATPMEWLLEDVEDFTGLKPEII
ncbi:hypothetical protein GQ53DRAFT_869811, partial [Thozetella sp. PMI_491]